jgi:hypothetical protein
VTKTLLFGEEKRRLEHVLLLEVDLIGHTGDISLLASGLSDVNNLGRRNNLGALLLVGLLFVLIGIAVLVGGVIGAVKQSREGARRVSATGTVVDLLKRVVNPGSGGIYCPVVEFTTAAGQTVRFESEFGTMPAGHQLGQSIGVKYDPGNPQMAEVDSATSRWLGPGCMIGMGVLFLGMGLVFLLIGIAVLASPNAFMTPAASASWLASG